MINLKRSGDFPLVRSILMEIAMTATGEPVLDMYGRVVYNQTGTVTYNTDNAEGLYLGTWEKPKKPKKWVRYTKKGRRTKRPRVKKPRKIDTFHVTPEPEWYHYEDGEDVLEKVDKIDVDVKVKIDEPITVRIEPENDEPLYEVVEIDGRRVRRIVRCENCNAAIGRKQHRAGEPCSYCGN